MYRLKPTALNTIKEKHEATSRTQLAALLDISVGTLRNLERASHQPHLNTVMRVCELTGMTVEDILTKTADL